MRIDEIIASKAPTFSVELFPPKTAEGTEALYETARSLRELDPDFVSVTYGAGGSTREGTVEITRALKDDLGFETMAHLSCVGESREGITTTIDRIAEAGIENIFALRGDPPKGDEDFVQPEGGLASAAELSEFISEGWDFTIGGACFPEVHPEAPDLETDLSYLKTKVESGAGFLITQLFFDNGLYYDFVARARAIGIEVPIVPGILPITTYNQLSRVTSMCGATIPDHVLTDLHQRRASDEAVAEFGVAYATMQCADLLANGAPGIHFYTLNRSPATRAILSNLRLWRPWDRDHTALGAPVRLATPV